MAMVREINFGLGEPDFSTPLNIVESGNAAALDGRTKYTPVGGIAELVEAARKAFSRDSGLSFSGEEVIIGAGSTHLISNAIQTAIIRSGRTDVVVIAPCWRKYRGLVEAMGAKVIMAEMDERDGFRISPEKIAGAMSARTAAVIVNNPSNPTGYVIPRADLEKIGGLAVKNGSYIIYDQIYSSIVFDAPFVSMAAISKEIRSATITIESCSKKYSMSGYRIGYAGAAKEIVETMRRIQDNTVWCLNAPSQHAAIEALISDRSQEAAALMVREFRIRRDYMHQRLNGLGLAHNLPEGSFSFFVKVPPPFSRSQEFTDYIQDRAHVKINPGTAFEKEGYVRFTFCCSIDDIKEGADRIGAALKDHVTLHHN